MNKIRTTFIAYVTLILVVILGIFIIRITIELKDTENTIDTKINCVAGYFNMPNRTGNTRLECK